jgi:DNA-binding transcriptional MerR regulator
MAKYSIKELEQLSGVKAHTIRIWEKRYSLISPERSHTNIRSYNDVHLKKILNVALLIKNGQKISVIAALTPNDLHEKVATIGSTTDADLQMQEKVNALVAAMIDFNSVVFESIFASVSLRIGFEETILQLIYPLLKKIGLYWATNKINPAEEHFISNLIRQKIIAAIDGVVITDKPKSTGVLYLPEGEYHEIGLLMAHYLLKKKGHKIYYLGCNVPYVDLIEVHRKTKPDFLFTFFTTSKPLQSAVAHITCLKNDISKSKIYYAGNESMLNDLIPTKRIVYMQSLSALKAEFS